MCLKSCVRRTENGPDERMVGMVLCHTGVVRGISRDGRMVKALDVKVNREKLKELLEECRKKPGIAEVHVEIKEGLLMVGEEIMRVIVAGDYRENVFPVMEYLVNAIKGPVTSKIEYYL